ncbi:MAG: PhoH family protein [Bacteroidales bacterium]|nr:PhoH family protein [Bacteroidales bacterium]
MIETNKESQNRELKPDKIIKLEGVDVRDFLGVKNIKFSKIVSYFPKLKLIARDNEIKVFGSTKDVHQFTDRFNFLLDYYHRYNSLSVEVIEDLLSDDDLIINGMPEDVIVFGNRGEQIRAKTPNQKVLAEAYKNKDLLFAVGPAGTGKTYTAIALAVAALKNKEVKRIVLTRPAVEAGEQLGFLPGDLKEKLDPYLQPLYDALFDMLPQRKLDQYFEEKVIEIAPLAFMRGRTLSNACVILDEAQNATINQLKMFLTRMGKNSKFMVTGDVTQIDLPKKHLSGLSTAMLWLKGIDEVQQVIFDQKDIVRHALVKKIVDAFELGEQTKEKE